MSRAGVFEEQGMRGRMEDAHVMLLNLYQHGDIFCGVYDGHSGSYAASYTAEVLHLRFAGYLSKGHDPKQAFIYAYRKVSQELSTETSGTTAATVYLFERNLTAANAGDCRAIIVSSEGVRQLTRDHRVEDTEERRRIIAHGGIIRGSYVMRDMSGLMPTRSLGDAFFEPAGVTSEPYVNSVNVQKDDLWLVCASDGLFDVMNNHEVAAVVRKADEAQAAADVLGREALEHRAGTDNLTAVVVDLSRSQG